MFKLMILFSMIFFSSCATQKFYLSEEGIPPGLTPTHEGKAHFFIYGIGQTKEVNARQVCDDRPIRMLETRFSFLDGFLSAITYGIYMPRSYAVYCGSKAKKKKIQEEETE